MSDQRERARRLSEFADSLLMPQRYEQRGAEFPLEDREFHELRELAQELADISIPVPDGFGERLARRVPELAAEDTPRRRLFRLWDRARVSAASIRPLSPVLIALVLLVSALLVRLVLVVPVVSASEILTRSDTALTHLVTPGHLLYRRWLVTTTTTETSGATRERTRTIREWMDGADFGHVAGRWSSPDGTLLVGYSSIAPDGERRPQVYFSPGVFGEARGLFSVEPTADEFGQAVRTFPEPVRTRLDLYLRRQYMYLPIVGERTFNRGVLDPPHTGNADFARNLLSFDRSEMNGTPVYRVRVIDPAFIDFNWRSDGPPRVRLGSAETVRYIAQDSFLSMRIEETVRLEDGRRRFTTRELVETRAVPLADLSLDPFRLEIPEGTPMQRQSALEHLAEVARAFGRLPDFTRSLVRPTSTH